MMIHYPLPDFPLQDTSLALPFKTRGVSTFHGALAYIQDLPYRRNSDRSDFRLVISEGCGTCSTKHALLARLAHEHGLPLRLTIGIYAMTEENTPGVGNVLRQYDLPFLPEAHCYLTWEGQRIDLTRRASGEKADMHFFHEEHILPEQIGDYKESLHHVWLQQWLYEFDVPSLSMENLWHIREECIAALGEIPL